MTVDMSPHAVTGRLRLVSDLREVCLALAARRTPTERNEAPIACVHTGTNPIPASRY